MDKSILRTNYRADRAKIKNRSYLDAEIFKRVSAFLDERKISSVFTYVSMKDEVDTFKLIDYYINRGVDVYIPKTQGGEMKTVKISDSALKFLDKFGNTDAAMENPVSNVKPDVVIVPMLAFNPNFYRLGNGGGYYDKFLSKDKYFSVGVAYDEQFCVGFVHEEHDVALDVIITPTKTLVREEMMKKYDSNKHFIYMFTKKL